VTQLDHPGGDWVLGGEPGEGRVQGEPVFVGDRRVGRDVGQFDPVTAATVLAGPLPTGGIDEDAAHGFRGGEDVSAIVPAAFVGRADEPEVRLVDQGGGCSV
jgi:hypothetical protein